MNGKKSRLLRHVSKNLSTKTKTAKRLYRTKALKVWASSDEKQIYYTLGGGMTAAFHK